MNKIHVIGLIVIALLLVNFLVVPTGSAQAQAKQELKISFRTDPSPAKGSGENTFHVSITDSARKAISDATVKITLVMPAMPEMNMAEMKVTPTVAWSGSDYLGKANVPSAGLWNVNIQVLKQNHLIASTKGQLMAK
jgi:YtkA-like